MDTDYAHDPVSRPPSKPWRPRWGLWMLVLAAVGLYVYSSWPRASALAWSTDLKAALEQARATHRPVLVEFQASWCGPCDWMKREVFPRKEVAKALDGWVPVQIDVDAQAHVAQEYGVESLPTFIVLAEDGRETRRTEGSMTPEEFIRFLGSADPRTVGSRTAP